MVNHGKLLVSELLYGIANSVSLLFIDMSNYFKNSEWIIDDMPVERNVLYYTCCDDPYPDVTFHLHLKVVTPVTFDELNSNVNLVIYSSTPVS